MEQTKRHALGQLLICKGCCCGRTDRGNPPIPEERLRTVWKSEHLNAAIQLTISGCLGPCDNPNVVQITTAHSTELLGHLSAPEEYAALIEWARLCRETGQVEPLPDILLTRRLSGFFTSDPTCEKLA